MLNDKIMVPELTCEKKFHALLDHDDRTTLNDLETEDDIGVEYFNEVASTPAGYDDMRLDDRPAVDETRYTIST